MRRYSIDTHPNKDLIIRDIAAGYSDEAVAERYGIANRQQVQRYRTRVLPEVMKLTAYRDADGLLAAITQNLVRVDKLLSGLEKWAEDPNNPEEFAMDPRADEIDVIYTVTTINAKGKLLRSRVKRNLQDVIDECFNAEEKFSMRLQTRKADQRVILLKAMETMGKYLQLLIDARKALSSESADNEYMSNIGELLQIIQTALRPYPEAMKALIEAIEANTEEQDGSSEPVRTAGAIEGVLEDS